jgi:hypothetical protein
MDVSVYKNEYMLGVNTSEVMFDWTGEWLGKTAGGTSYYEFLLYTDYENGWKATSSETWLTIDKPGSGKTPSAGENLQISAGENKTGGERVGKITLTAGLLTKEITVRQSGGANSIIVKNGQPLRIPLAYVDTARLALGLPLLTGTGVDVILWNNKINNLSPSISSGEISSGALTLIGAEWDNALVVLTANSGADTLWSWHVWVVNDDNINRDYHNNNRNYTPVFMDRLRGGSPDGAQPKEQPYYQWGRKDPFLSGRYGLENATTNMIKKAVENPSMFYIGSFPEFSWAGHGYDQYNNNNMWNDIDGKKTYSDPCPAGWRVPYYKTGQTTPWQNETDLGSYNNTGYISESGVEYMLSGEGGFIWSAATAALNHQIYYAKVSATDPFNEFDRAFRGNGFTVRCVKDISRKY